MMNPNIQPSFLMFNNTIAPVNGMPTGSITNTTFARMNYTWETPGFGSLTPSVTWAQLNHTNPHYSTCIVSTTLPNSPISNPCVGENKALGEEIDIAYRYTTKDRVNAGIDLGYWLVGNAWQEKGKDAIKNAYGLRFFAGTEF